MIPQHIEEDFKKNFSVMIERSGYSNNEIEEIYNFLSKVYKDGYEAKSKEHKHNWIFVGKSQFINGLGQKGNKANKFICPDCGKEKNIDY